MSQHQIILPDGKTMRIGWDRPMRTFFAQIEKEWETVSTEVRNAIYEATAGDESRDSYGRQIEEAEERLNRDNLILWLGGNFDEFPELDRLVEALKKDGYAVTPEMVTQLAADKKADPPIPGFSNTPFENFLRSKT